MKENKSHTLRNLGFGAAAAAGTALVLRKPWKSTGKLLQVFPSREAKGSYWLHKLVPRSIGTFIQKANKKLRPGQTLESRGAFNAAVTHKLVKPMTRVLEKIDKPSYQAVNVKELNEMKLTKKDTVQSLIQSKKELEKVKLQGKPLEINMDPRMITIDANKLTEIPGLHKMIGKTYPLPKKVTTVEALKRHLNKKYNKTSKPIDFYFKPVKEHATGRTPISTHLKGENMGRSRATDVSFTRTLKKIQKNPANWVAQVAASKGGKEFRDAFRVDHKGVVTQVTATPRHSIALGRLNRATIEHIKSRGKEFAKKFKLKPGQQALFGMDVIQYSKKSKIKPFGVEANAIGEAWTMDHPNRLYRSLYGKDIPSITALKATAVGATVATGASIANVQKT